MISGGFVTLGGQLKNLIFVSLIFLRVKAVWLLLTQDSLHPAIEAENCIRLCYTLWNHDSIEWYEYRETFQNLQHTVLERVYSTEVEYNDACEYSDAVFDLLVEYHPCPFSTLAHVIYFDNTAPFSFGLKSIINGSIKSFHRPGLVPEDDYNVFNREFFVGRSDPPGYLPCGDSEADDADTSAWDGE